MGLRNKRLRGEDYDCLIDEFMAAVTDKFPNVLVQFEDFANLNASRLLEKYRYDYCMFNDDIQGTGAVTLAGILSAMRLLNQSLQDQQILFYGAGAAAFGIAEIIIQKMVQDGMDMGNARRKICFFDSRGLVVKGRSNLTNQKMLYAHELAEESNLESAIDSLQPNILIGVSGQGGSFSETIVRKMGEINNRPIIFALSNPTSKSDPQQQ